VVFDHPSPAALATHLASRLDGDSATQATPNGQAAHNEQASPAGIERDLESASAEELFAFIDKELS